MPRHCSRSDTRRPPYASSRRSLDALATLAALRSRLAEDLGVDPSAVIRAVEQAILTQDSGLVTGSVRVASRQHGRVRVGRRCRAVSGGYVVAHTPVVPVGATGTMTG